MSCVRPARCFVNRAQVHQYPKFVVCLGYLYCRCIASLPILGLALFPVGGERCGSDFVFLYIDCPSLRYNSNNSGQRTKQGVPTCVGDVPYIRTCSPSLSLMFGLVLVSMRLVGIIWNMFIWTRGFCEVAA